MINTKKIYKKKNITIKEIKYEIFKINYQKKIIKEYF